MIEHSNCVSSKIIVVKIGESGVRAATFASCAFEESEPRLRKPSDLLSHDYLSRLCQEAGLAIHRVASRCASVQNQDRKMFIARLAHCCVPQVHARREIDVAAAVVVIFQRTPCRFPLPSHLRRIVAGRLCRTVNRYMMAF